MRQSSVENIAVFESGREDAPPILFLHGWPQSSVAFAAVTRALGDEVRALAIDLPGIGASVTPVPAQDKKTLAGIVHRLIGRMGLRDVTLVGHDVGGMIAYAFLKQFPDTLARAVILDVVIPGIEPWSKVLGNPKVWHFGFHAVPELPEMMVRGREAAYFDFFFNAIAADPSAIGPEARRAYVEAYRRPEALRTGFEWYRAFAQDAKDNEESRERPVATPVLYMRGSEERGELSVYVSELGKAGLRVRGEKIDGCGHFSPDEKPDALAAALRRFMGER